MAKRFLASLALCLLLGFSFAPVFAAEAAAPAGGDAKNVPDAVSPNKCGGESGQKGDKKVNTIPSNCLFLEEPIGGKANFDLYVVDCLDGLCTYKVWNGGSIQGSTRGPLQAILTREAGKEQQGPFGLLYNYIALVYNYMSGLIIGISVFFVVVGGIQITTSHGDEGVSQGKSRIIKALTGIIVWFAASLILYTINPTFFAF